MRSGAHGGPKRTDFKRRHLIFEAASSANSNGSGCDIAAALATSRHGDASQISTKFTYITNRPKAGGPRHTS